jgi:hypothetical protein
MGHPDEGMIRALLDEEATGEKEDARTHLATCPRCEEEAAEQTADLQVLAEALALLDTDPPVQAARARILEEAQARRKGVRMIRRSLPRAASFAVLITAGAAAALPGSPVRQWLADGWRSLGGTPGPVATEALEGVGEPPYEGTVEGTERVGATLPVGQGGLELHVRDLSPLASLTILLVEGTRAGVFSEEGTRFRTEDGRLEALGPPGDVTLEIPSGAGPITVVVNGEVYLRRTAGGLQILGPVQTRTPAEIRFGPSGSRPNPPDSGG